jgi:toxin ParE1/3/4
VTAKPVRPRSLARRDVDEAIDHFLAVVGDKVALAFVDSLEAAFRLISRNPAAGSPRYAHELGIEDLRCWGVRRFPQIVFYVERADHIDVWRVLHGQRDIPATMRDPDEREGPEADKA